VLVAAIASEVDISSGAACENIDREFNLKSFISVYLSYYCTLDTAVCLPFY